MAAYSNATTGTPLRRQSSGSEQARTANSTPANAGTLPEIRNSTLIQPSRAREREMGVPLERDLSTAAAVYSQDRQGSRTALDGSRREVANRLEQQREQQRDATVSRLTRSVGDPPRRSNLAASQARDVHSSHGAPRKVTKIAHFDIDHKHVHCANCGHHNYNGRWYDYSRDHRHGPIFGHHFQGGSSVSFSIGHRHGSDCGHYYYGGVRNVYPRSYYTRGRKNNFYFFVNLGDFRRRNLPKYVYEESVFIEEDQVHVYEDSSPRSRAYAAFGKGSFYESVIAFNESIDADPENGVLYLARAQADIAIADYRTAYEDLIRGMELVPEWTEVEFSVAELYANPDWFEEHYESLARWVSDYPRDYKAHFVLGYIHYFQQDYTAAKSEFIYTFAWDKDHPQAGMLMDSILVFEEETEVRAVEKEEVEALEEEQKL